MSRRAYSEINLHITWHVKADAPILKDDIQQHLYRHLHERVLDDPDVFRRRFSSASGSAG